jgi:hypothetical protein
MKNDAISLPGTLKIRDLRTHYMQKWKCRINVYLKVSSSIAITPVSQEE